MTSRRLLSAVLAVAGSVSFVAAERYPAGITSMSPWDTASCGGSLAHRVGDYIRAFGLGCADGVVAPTALLVLGLGLLAAATALGLGSTFPQSFSYLALGAGASLGVLSTWGGASTWVLQAAAASVTAALLARFLAGRLPYSQKKKKEGGGLSAPSLSVWVVYGFAAASLSAVLVVTPAIIFGAS